MSVLEALSNAYERLADRGDVPPFGYSNEKIGFLIALAEDGAPVGPPIDLREEEGKRRIAPLMAVPASFKRPGVTPRSFFLWDNTAFALGVTASESKDAAARLAAFRERHLKELANTNDPGLLALLHFVKTWTPDRFRTLGWPEDMKDQNVVFALESERRTNVRIHDRPAARALWARLISAGIGGEAICLVSGERRPIARIHPAIKGIISPGAPKGADSLVSFNEPAFESYLHTQGDNAPVSEAAAFAYTAALNKFLERNSPHRIQVGDASTVFWADASDAEAATGAEALFGALVADIPIDETIQAGKIRAVLKKIREGRPIADAAPDLAKGVRFFVLGLSPNAARLSVRFWLEDDFGVIAERFARHLELMRIDPPPKEENPSIWRCLIETATQRESKNIPPKLAGEWMGAILTGTPYPLTLLATVLMRLRADKGLRADQHVNALRVAILKAVLMSRGKEVPVSLDPENKDPGYLLGRLFATYENIQMAALGGRLNSTIRDKFYGAASATPRKVFSLLDKGSANHLAKLAKEKKGYAIVLEKQIAAIMEHFDPSADPFPAFLTSDQQSLFAVGYYHQKYHREEAGAAEAASEETPS